MQVFIRKKYILLTAYFSDISVCNLGIWDNEQETVIN